MRVIKDVLPKTSFSDAVVQLNASHSTQNKILKDRSNIERVTLENERSRRKSKRAWKNEVVKIINIQ